MLLLRQMLADIQALKDTSSLAVEDFFVCSPFTVVRLNDGSFGSAGNYEVQNHQPGYQADLLRKQYAMQICDDPLLFHTLQEDSRPAALSLRVAILSALSQSLLEPNSLASAGLTCTPLLDPQEPLESRLRPGDTVSLIGYGGGLETFCASKRVSRLYVCDFAFQHRKYRDLAWQRIKQITDSSDRVTLVDGESRIAPLLLSNVCFITGSALCNGTMEGLLANAQGCREVIVQGPSCSIFPPALFRSTVTMLLTTRKSAEEFEAGKLPTNDIYEFADRDYIAIFGR
jgi:hypothetical protein